MLTETVRSIKKKKNVFRKPKTFQQSNITWRDFYIKMYDSTEVGRYSVAET